MHMTSREYFDKCREYSDTVAENSKAARELIDSDPELIGTGAYEKYWDLHNAATSAALNWSNFCTNNKPSGF